MINLREDTVRREAIQKQLNRLGLEYTFFEAIRGSEHIDSAMYDDLGARKLEGRSLRAGEIGCALSHAALYAEIVRLGLPMALILEDDAILSEALPSILTVLESGVLAQGDLVSLSRCDAFIPWSARPITQGFRIADPFLVRYGSIAQTVGYVITREAAKAIELINIPVRFPADSWGHYLGMVRFRGLLPSLSLVTQRVELGSRTSESGTRKEFVPYRVWDLIWHGFKTYNPIGRRLKRIAKNTLGR